MVQVATLADAILAVLPAAALFFGAYGRYDGLFRDNVVFLHFIGGLLLGGFLGFLALFVYAGIPNELIEIVGVALVVPIALVACINRKKWQGERHSIFNGGALGLGASVMMSLSFLYFHTLRAPEVALAPATLVQGVLLAVGLAGLLFALGLFAGDAVRQKKQFRGAFLGTAVLLAPAVFLAELAKGWQFGTGGEWLWSLLLAAFGIIVGVATERKLLPEGVPPEARKTARRQRRRDRSAE